MARRMRRRTEWLAVKIGSTSLGADSDVLVTLKTSSQLRDVAGAEPTIVRIRGVIYGGMTITPDDSTHTTRLYGAIRCVHDGVTTAPDLGDASVAEDDDWMWYAATRLDAPFQERQYWNGSTAVTYARTWRGSQSFFHWNVDVKAARKAPDPCALQLCLTTESINETPSVQFGGLLRILLKQTP